MSNDQLSRAQNSNLQQFANSGRKCGPSGCSRIAFSCPRKTPATSGNTASTYATNPTCGRLSQDACAQKYSVLREEGSSKPSESMSEMVYRRFNKCFGGAEQAQTSCKPCGKTEIETKSCSRPPRCANIQPNSCKRDELSQIRQYKPCNRADKPCNRVAPLKVTSQCNSKGSSGSQIDKANDNDSLPIGTSVRIASIPDCNPKVRRGKGRILAVVLYIDDSGKYKLGTRKGVIGQVFSRDELEPCGRELLSTHDIPRNTINMLEASTMAF